MTPHYNRLYETVLMMGNNICFKEVMWKIIPKYPFYPFLSGAPEVQQLLEILGHLKAYEYTAMFCCHFFKGRLLLLLPVCFPWQMKLFQKKVCSLRKFAPKFDHL